MPQKNNSIHIILLVHFQKLLEAVLCTISEIKPQFIVHTGLVNTITGFLIIMNQIRNRQINISFVNLSNGS